MIINHILYSSSESRCDLCNPGCPTLYSFRVAIPMGALDPMCSECWASIYTLNLLSYERFHGDLPQAEYNKGAWLVETPMRYSILVGTIVHRPQIFLTFSLSGAIQDRQQNANSIWTGNRRSRLAIMKSEIAAIVPYMFYRNVS